MNEMNEMNEAYKAYKAHRIPKVKCVTEKVALDLAMWALNHTAVYIREAIISRSITLLPDMVEQALNLYDDLNDNDAFADGNPQSENNNNNNNIDSIGE
jgi:hypothetical protein